MVYFLIRNIDNWTIGKFQERISRGVKDLVDAVVRRGQKYEPWKRVGEISSTLRGQHKENQNISMTTDSTSPLPKAKTRRRRER